MQQMGLFLSSKKYGKKSKAQIYTIHFQILIPKFIIESLHFF